MDKISCPKCGHKFELSESIAGPLVAAARAEADASATARIEAARVKAKVDAEKAQAEVVAALKRESKGAADSERAMAAKLSIAQQAQAEALRKSRELDDKMREADLAIEQKVSEQVAAARIAARQAAEETVGAKLAERDLQIESLKRASEELRRKLEQGSMQVQGEQQELALEAALQARFALDEVIPVGKGIQGGDCMLAVQGGAGKILFESKNTKAWSPGWIAKLRDDGRAAKADLLVIVSTVLPKGFEEGFGYFDGVWATLPRHAIPLTAALRMSLFELSAARKAGEGAETKALQVYDYMKGPRFKARIQAIVEAFSTMREDLDSERRAITKQWAKREAQIERVLQGTVGMYGDLQAIAGRSLAEIEGLSIEGPK